MNLNPSSRGSDGVLDGLGAPSSEGFHACLAGEAESHMCGRQGEPEVGRQVGDKCLNTLPSCPCASFSHSPLGNQPTSILVSC